MLPPLLPEDEVSDPLGLDPPVSRLLRPADPEVGSVLEPEAVVSVEVEPVVVVRVVLDPVVLESVPVPGVEVSPVDEPKMAEPVDDPDPAPTETGSGVGGGVSVVVELEPVEPLLSWAVESGLSASSTQVADPPDSSRWV